MIRQSRLAVAAAALVLSAGVAAAATGITETDLNMRRGPGTGYGVITAIPANSAVEVLDCAAGWCEIEWAGHHGYSSRAYLDIGDDAYATVSPSVVYDVPTYYYDAPAYYTAPAFHGRRLRGARPAIRLGVPASHQDFRRGRSANSNVHVPRGPRHGMGNIGAHPPRMSRGGPRQGHMARPHNQRQAHQGRRHR